MASGIAITKSSLFHLRHLRPPRWLRSRIGRLIFLGNFAGLAILVAGALLLTEMRAQLIQAKIDSLTIQGEVVGNVLAETATVGDPEPQLLDQRARAVLQRLLLPTATRVRVYTIDGDLVADSSVLSDRIIERELPDIAARQEQPPLAQRLGQAAENVSLAFWRPDFNRVEEHQRAAAGERVAGQRRGENNERVVSVSLPIQRVQAVVGVLTLEAGDVETILWRERAAMIPFFFAALFVALATSALLALTIAAPLRRLAAAADSLRRTGATRLSLPTERKRRDEIGELAQSLERMTGALADRIDGNERFAADVMHEIKNPLTSIRSAVETISNVRDDEPRKKLLTIIQADVRRLDRMITDIARASFLEAETARGGVAPLDLGRLLADIAETYAMTRRESEAAVMFKAPAPADAIVMGQDGPLGQVFRNLIDNAKSFSPAGGVVTVSVAMERRREGKVVRAEVTDQGPGIRPEHLENIFTRFYTDRPQGAAFGSNSGLGLSIARQIVESHKGRIWAENIPGVAHEQRLGARLIVELPAVG